MINPVGVLGPVLGPDYSTSILLVQRLLDLPRGRMSEAEWLALVPGDVIAVPHLSLIGEWEYFANIPVYSQWREKFSSSEAIMGGKAVRDRPLCRRIVF